MRTPLPEEVGYARSYQNRFKPQNETKNQTVDRPQHGTGVKARPALAKERETMEL